MTKASTISDKAQEASYVVAQMVAKTKSPHTIAENLVKPAVVEFAKIMFGSKVVNEIKAIPMSDNTVSRRIDEMSQDIEETGRLQAGYKIFSLQLDESTDYSGFPQLLGMH